MGTLQLKNISEKTKRKLRSRAKDEGMSMSEYVLRLIERDLGRLRGKELLRRLEQLPQHDDWPTGGELLEEARREREQELGW
jgi:hypothetical protein